MARTFLRIAALLALALVGSAVLFAGGQPDKQGATPSAAAAPAAKPAKFKEAPELAELVKAGKLPPVEQRLPENPAVVKPIEQIGVYGGAWKFFIDSQSRLVDVGEFTDIGLLRWKRDQSGPEPCMAEGWEVKDGGKEFVIKLRKGLKWSDGHPFTADDVVFWWEDIVMNNEIYPIKPYYMFTATQKLGTVVKNDDYSVSFKFPEPHGMFILYLTKEIWTFAPKHYVSQFLPKYTPKEKLDAMAKEKGFKTWIDLLRYKFNTFGPGATGGMNNPELPVMFPWIPTQEPPSERFIFKRNPYFYKVDTDGNQLPYIDQVDVRVATAEVMNLKIIAGEPNFQVSQAAGLPGDAAVHAVRGKERVQRLPVGRPADLGVRALAQPDDARPRGPADLPGRPLPPRPVGGHQPGEDQQDPVHGTGQADGRDVAPGREQDLQGLLRHRLHPVRPGAGQQVARRNGADEARRRRISAQARRQARRVRRGGARPAPRHDRQPEPHQGRLQGDRHRDHHQARGREPVEHEEHGQPVPDRRLAHGQVRDGDGPRPDQQQHATGESPGGSGTTPAASRARSRPRRSRNCRRPGARSSPTPTRRFSWLPTPGSCSRTPTTCGSSASSGRCPSRSS